MDRTELRATLAQNIKTFRGRRNWSQADLAEKSGLSIVYLSDIERGNKWPYLDTLVKLATALNIEVYELLKPENTPLPVAASILDNYTKEVIAIFEKSLEMAQKRSARHLLAVQKQYLSQ